MKFFLDTEFIESGPRWPIQLISIGLVAEDGREYYAISREFRGDDANDWVKANVLLQLDRQIERKGVREIGREVESFVFCEASGLAKPEFWGYYADYDWVVFCQMFGSMMNLPKGFPMYCRDIKQLCDECGNPRLPLQSSTEHNALHDARWNKQAFDFLRPRRLELIKAAWHALESYAHGNSSPDLAEEMCRTLRPLMPKQEGGA